MIDDAKMLKPDKYELAIKNRDLTAVLDEFNKDFEDFKDECRRIRTELLHCESTDLDSARILKMEYNRLWSRFSNKIPFPYYEQYIDTDEKIRLSEILPKEKGKKIRGYEDYLDGLLNYIVRYNAYILQKSNIKNREIILYSSLKTISKNIDLNPMTITPTKVVKLVDKVMEDIQNGNLERPVATFYDGKLYENEKMNSSTKVAKYRGMRLYEFLNLFIDDYKLNNDGELPNREEVKEHLVRRCASSGDKRLEIFKDNMNDKTLTKLIEKGGFKNLISSSRKKKKKVILPPINESSNSKNSMTLYEVFNILKEGFYKRQKNNHL